MRSRDPILYRNRDSVLLLHVALALERQKIQSLIVGKIQQRPGHGIERRRLVEVRICGAQAPSSCLGSVMATPSRGSKAFSVMIPEKCVIRSPPVNVSQFGLELILQRNQAVRIRRDGFSLVEFSPGSVIGDQRDSRNCPAAQRRRFRRAHCFAFDPSQRRSGRPHSSTRGCRSRSGHRRSALVSRPVEVVKRRGDQHQARRKRVRPCAGRENSCSRCRSLISGRLHIRIVGHLVIVEPQAGIETNWSLGCGL